jgi:hypothetical protein
MNLKPKQKPQEQKKPKPSKKQKKGWQTYNTPLRG